MTPLFLEDFKKKYSNNNYKKEIRKFRKMYEDIFYFVRENLENINAELFYDKETASLIFRSHSLVDYKIVDFLGNQDCLIEPFVPIEVTAKIDNNYYPVEYEKKFSLKNECHEYTNFGFKIFNHITLKFVDLYLK